MSLNQITHQKFSQLLRDLARRVGVSDSQEISEDGQVLFFEPNLEVAISCSQREGLIFLSCPLCELNRDEPASTYRSLLEANLFWFETGGATLSLDGVTNRVLMADQRVLELTNAENLEQWLDEFLRNAKKWSAILENRNMGVSDKIGLRELA